MRFISHARTAVGLFFAVILTASPSPVLAQETLPDQSSEALHGTLSKILEVQSEAWNRGSIRDFMSAYWKSEKLTFSSGGVTRRGWQTTLDRYLSRYPDRETMGKLVFSELETQTLGGDSALMLGKWKLQREQLADMEGNFSLVWRKIEDKWFIIHDHTSSLAP